MKLRRIHFGLLLVAGLAMPFAAVAQAPEPNSNDDNRPVISRDTLPEAGPRVDENRPPAQPADGRRRGLPLATFAVPSGTRVLVRLEDDLSTRDNRENRRFKVKTLEPLEAGAGIYLPPGAEIRGHISRVEPAGVSGHARLWLTFDEIRTKFGTLPIVADVISVPGDHSLRSGPNQPGLIEGRTSNQHAAAEEAAEGAAVGAVRGVKHKNAKEAAEGAAEAALAAYLMATGRGHEIELPKGAKLELELERELYLVRE